MGVDYGLLIFDLDGTLIDSREDIVSAFNWTLSQQGLAELPPDVISKHVGKGVQPFLQQTLQKGEVSEAARALEKFRAYYLAHATQKTRLYKGIAELLLLYSSTPKIVLSNKSNDFILPLLRDLGVEQHFVACYGLESFPTCKPSPEPIRTILQKLKLNCHQAIIIGDTEVDILAGQQAGIATCAALYGYGDPLVLRSLSPTYLAEQPEELLKVLNQGPR